MAATTSSPTMEWIAGAMKPAILTFCVLSLLYIFTFGAKREADHDYVRVYTAEHYKPPSGCNPRIYYKTILYKIPKACEAASQQVDLRRDSLSGLGGSIEWLRIDNDAIKASCRFSDSCVVHAVIRNKYVLIPSPK